MLLGAAFMLQCFALPQYFRAIESSRWPQANGIITMSSLEMGYFKQMKGYYGVVEYDYRVGGVSFHGTRLSFNKVHLAVEDAWQPILKSYPVGKQVTVYYDSKDPSTGVLEPGLLGEMRSLYVLCIFFVLLFAGAFLLALFWT